MSEVTQQQESSSGPRCPNHGCPLILAPGQKTLTKGEAPCAISGALFDFEQSVQEGATKKDKFGNIIHSFSVKGPGEE